MVLGTMPDRVVTEHLSKTRNRVAIMRRALGLNAVDLRTWDGAPRTQIIAPEELQFRVRSAPMSSLTRHMVGSSVQELRGRRDAAQRPITARLLE